MDVTNTLLPAEAAIMQLVDTRYRVLSQALGVDLQPVGTLRQNSRFRNPHSIYEKYVDQISSEVRSKMSECPAVELVAGNPFAPSAYRDGGTLAWDSAFGLHAEKEDCSNPVQPRDVRAQIRCNDEWQRQILPQLGRVGPLGPGGALVRPQGPAIIDFQALSDGWDLLEMAHVLAHSRTDTGGMRKWTPTEAEDVTRCEFHQAVGEIAVAQVLGLPIDVTPRNRHTRNHSHLPYGLDVQVSLDVLNPRIAMPWFSPGGPVFDKTLAVVSVGLLIGPVPAGWANGSGVINKTDRWTGLPTLAVIAGWAPIEMLAQAQLAEWTDARWEKNVASILCVDDFLPSHLLHQHVKLAVNRGVAI